MRTGLKKLIVLTLAFAMVLTGFGFENWNLGSAWAASAGEVTEIGTAEELAALGGKQLTGEYRLTKDIDMSGVSMQPIRSIRDGSFDGSGHKIKNLSISADGNAGLFAKLERDTVIKELILENCNIENTSGSYNGAGAMVGYVAAKGSTIELSLIHI